MATSTSELNPYPLRNISSPLSSCIRGRRTKVAVVEPVSNQRRAPTGNLVNYGIADRRPSAATDVDFNMCNPPDLSCNDVECKAPSVAADRVTVPVFICLIIIVGYIFGGAVLFTLWEDWDILTGSYFCFITLSTIGFGDIVPGTEENKWASHEKLVLCALWLAFGLSLLAMCFNLMQEEVREKFRRVGLKLGLIKDELLDAADADD